VLIGTERLSDNYIIISYEDHVNWPISLEQSLVKECWQLLKHFVCVCVLPDLPPAAGYHSHGDDCCHGHSHEIASDKPPSYVQSIAPTEDSNVESNNASSSPSPSDDASSHATEDAAPQLQPGLTTVSDSVLVSESDSATVDVDSLSSDGLLVAKPLPDGESVASLQSAVTSDSSQENVEDQTNVDTSSSSVAPSSE